MIAGCIDVCPDPCGGTARGSKTAPDSVSPWDARRRMGKTNALAVRGGEVTAGVASAVGKHPLPISQSRRRFALYSLCRVERTEEADWEVSILKAEGQSDSPADVVDVRTIWQVKRVGTHGLLNGYASPPADAQDTDQPPSLSNDNYLCQRVASGALPPHPVPAAHVGSQIGGVTAVAVCR